MGTNQIGRPQMAGKLRIQFHMEFFFKAARTFYIQLAPDPRSQIAQPQTHGGPADFATMAPLHSSVGFTL